MSRAQRPHDLAPCHAPVPCPSALPRCHTCLAPPPVPMQRSHAPSPWSAPHPPWPSPQALIPASRMPGHAGAEWYPSGQGMGLRGAHRLHLYPPVSILATCVWPSYGAWPTHAAWPHAAWPSGLGAQECPCVMPMCDAHVWIRIGCPRMPMSRSRPRFLLDTTPSSPRRTRRWLSAGQGWAMALSMDSARLWGL